jgi:hypothetical protein
MEIMSTNQFAVSFNADREALSYLLVWPQTFQRYVGSSQPSLFETQSRVA